MLVTRITLDLDPTTGEVLCVETADHETDTPTMACEDVAERLVPLRGLLSTLHARAPRDITRPGRATSFVKLMQVAAYNFVITSPTRAEAMLYLLFVSVIGYGPNRELRVPTTEVGKSLGLSQPSVVQALARLCDKGVLTKTRKDGQVWCYRVNRKHAFKGGIADAMTPPPGRQRPIDPMTPSPHAHPRVGRRRGDGVSPPLDDRPVDGMTAVHQGAYGAIIAPGVPVAGPVVFSFLTAMLAFDGTIGTRSAVMQACHQLGLVRRGDLNLGHVRDAIDWLVAERWLETRPDRQLRFSPHVAYRMLSGEELPETGEGPRPRFMVLDGGV